MNTVKLNLNELQILNAGKGNMHTISFFKELGWTLKESNLKDEIFTGLFINEDNVALVKTFEDVIVSVELS